MEVERYARGAKKYPVQTVRFNSLKDFYRMRMAAAESRLSQNEFCLQAIEASTKRALKGKEIEHEDNSNSDAVGNGVVRVQ